MKKAYSFLLVAASLLLASAAQAQGMHVRANVPFDFTVGKTVFSAGTYDIARIGLEDKVLLLRSGNKSSMATAQECASTLPSTKTVLVFRETEQGYALYQIWTQGNSTGREFPQPKGEPRLAQNGKPAEVIIAANLVK
jgi:hypothetical protein